MLMKVKKNQIEAFKYAKRSADSGNVDAYLMVSNMYFNGQGVEKDLEKAFEYSMRGAVAGHTGCMRELSMMFEYGEGVQKDWDQALKYLKMAADAGDDYEKQRLEILKNDSIKQLLSTIRI